MRRGALIGLVLGAALWRGAQAESFVKQATFATSFSTIAAMDTDSLGNLYLLGLAPGSTTYQVRSYAMPAFTPQFAFDTKVSSPMAFAVEASGTVDVLDARGFLTLMRFSNAGQPVASAVFNVNTASMSAVVQGFGTTTFSGLWLKSAAINKANGRLYIAYQYQTTWTGCGVGFGFSTQCSPTTSTALRGAVNQYDLSGNELAIATLSGVYGTINGAPWSMGCYTPGLVTTDLQGRFYVSDATCQQVISFSTAASQIGSLALSGAPSLLWTDSALNLYVEEPVCGATGCSPGVAQMNSSGSTLTTIAATPNAALSADSRLLYAASGSTLARWVYDAPPSVAVESAPIGSLLQHSSDVFMSWQGATDPDGDAVAYNIYVGTSPTSLSLAAVAVPATSTDVFLPFGSTYYWQVIAQDSYAGVPVLQTSAPVVAFNLNFLNHPPGPFAVTAGTGTVVTRSTSAVIAWQPASDPDGDPVVYDVSWQASRTSTPTVVTTTATFWAMSGLSFGTTAYWSVTARDPYGATRPITGGTLSYLPFFLNNPPPAPAVTGGIGILGQHTLTPVVNLAWSPVMDPDGDPVAYRLLVGVSSTSLALVQDSTATAYTLTPTFGATYYWQVAAYDPYGGASTGTPASVLVYLSNQPPQAFAVTSGSGTVLTRQASWPLSWQPAIDPDGDALTYDVAVGTAPGALVLVQSSSVTTYSLGFQFGTSYYWQATARDGFGGAVVSGVQTFVPVFLNSAPAVPQLASISPTVKTMDGGVRVSWSKVASPEGDALTYTAYVGDAPNELAVVASVVQSSGSSVVTAAPRALGARPAAVVQDQGDTVVLFIRGLDYYKNYYLRVGATTVYGAASQSALLSFQLAAMDGFPRAYNYPNPFSPNRGGTHVVFNAPPSGYAHAVLTVYSEFGSKLLEREYGPLSPGITQYDFDGREGGGRPLMNGSYVARVRFDGPSDRATFFLLVVK